MQSNLSSLYGGLISYTVPVATVNKKVNKLDESKLYSMPPTEASFPSKLVAEMLFLFYIYLFLTIPIRVKSYCLFIYSFLPFYGSYLYGKNPGQHF
jgi:hypothetical protein